MTPTTGGWRRTENLFLVIIAIGTTRYLGFLIEMLALKAVA